MPIVLGRNWGGECSYSNKLESVGDFYSCNFLSILHPFLGIFTHSRLCEAFYNWNCHLFRKNPSKNGDLKQSMAAMQILGAQKQHIQ